MNPEATIPAAGVRAQAAREQRYREAEGRLWASVGVAPAERRVRLPRAGVNVRVQEAGEGPPVLFIHGGPNSGSTWVPLVGRLPGYHCLMVDRPGTGLSDPLPVNRRTVSDFADGFVADVLDALSIPRAHLVLSSFGGYIGLRSAVAHPERVGRIVLMGCPAFVPGMHLPPFMRFLLVPGGRQLMAAMPPSAQMNRRVFQQIGHGASLDAGRIPGVFFDWYLSLQRDTDTMANEAAMIASLGSIGGFDPSLTLSPALLGSVRAPARFLWGEDDTFGGADVARATTALVPDAGLELVPRGGHLPWLDDPGRAAQLTMTFLQE
jgi:2-hydroxy-6-oxonona-2,4-dienedioate hydrolase